MSSSISNLLILYNPYYNEEMIEDHIRILDAAADPVQARVGFGKIRSRIRDFTAVLKMGREYFKPCF